MPHARPIVVARGTDAIRSCSGPDQWGVRAALPSVSARAQHESIRRLALHPNSIFLDAPRYFVCACERWSWCPAAFCGAAAARCPAGRLGLERALEWPRGRRRLWASRPSGESVLFARAHPRLGSNYRTSPTGNGGAEATGTSRSRCCLGLGVLEARLHPPRPLGHQELGLFGRPSGAGGRHWQHWWNGGHRWPGCGCSRGALGADGGPTFRSGCSPRRPCLSRSGLFLWRPTTRSSRIARKRRRRLSPRGLSCWLPSATRPADRPPLRSSRPTRTPSRSRPRSSWRPWPWRSRSAWMPSWHLPKPGRPSRCAAPTLRRRPLPRRWRRPPSLLH